MTSINNYKKFNLHPNFYSFRKSSIGVAYLFKFDVLAVSVVRNICTYGNRKGLYELAIGELDKDGSFHFRYDTPITEDVIGYLSVDDVLEILDRVKELKNIKQVYGGEQ